MYAPRQVPPPFETISLGLPLEILWFSSRLRKSRTKPPSEHSPVCLDRLINLSGMINFALSIIKKYRESVPEFPI